MCTKMLRNLNEKFRAKFPGSTGTHGYSMVKIVCLNDAFSEFFELEANPVEGQSLQQKSEKENLDRQKDIILLKRHRSLYQNFDFCAYPSNNVVKHDASGMKGMLSCCKCLFEEIGANFAHIQPKNLQNVQKMHFWQKAVGVNGIILRTNISL